MVANCPVFKTVLLPFGKGVDWLAGQGSMASSIIQIKIARHHQIHEGWSRSMEHSQSSLLFEDCRQISRNARKIWILADLDTREVFVVLTSEVWLILVMMCWRFEMRFTCLESSQLGSRTLSHFRFWRQHFGSLKGRRLDETTALRSRRRYVAAIGSAYNFYIHRHFSYYVYIKSGRIAQFRLASRLQYEEGE